MSSYRRQRAQTQTQEVPLNIRKHFFTVHMTEHWHMLPREAIGNLQKPPEYDLGTLVLGGPA